MAFFVSTRHLLSLLAVLALFAIAAFFALRATEDPFTDIEIGMNMEEIDDELWIKGDKLAGKMERFFPPFFVDSPSEECRVWCNDDYCVEVYFDTSTRKATRIKYYSTRRTTLEQLKDFFRRSDPSSHR